MISSSDEYLYRKYLANTITDLETGCMVWQGSTNPNGYAQATSRSRARRLGTSTLLRVHRFVAFHVRGIENPDPLVFVMHTCDNPPCINPEHLRLGNQSLNIQDSFNKDRHSIPVHKGEANFFAKLTWEEVKGIRDKFASRTRTKASLAREYNVHTKTITRIVAKQSWT